MDFESAKENEILGGSVKRPMRSPTPTKDCEIKKQKLTTSPGHRSEIIVVSDGVTNTNASEPACRHTTADCTTETGPSAVAQVVESIVNCVVVSDAAKNVSDEHKEAPFPTSPSSVTSRNSPAMTPSRRTRGRPPALRVPSETTPLQVRIDKEEVRSAQKRLRDEDLWRKKQEKEEQKRIEREKKEQEKKEKEMEKERKKQEEEARKEEKRKEDAEKREKKRLEEEERKEKKRREDEERKEKKRLEEEEKKEKKRLEEEEKARKKEEINIKKREDELRKEAKRKEEEDKKEAKRKEEEAMEEKKKRVSMTFKAYFNKVEKSSEWSSETTSDTKLWYKPFQVREGVTMAPIHRRQPLHPELDFLENCDKIGHSNYLKSDAVKNRKIVSCRQIPLRAKIFQFHDNYRPPYYGTWRKRSTKVSGRTPFGNHEEFDYEFDSDAEWEEEPSDAEECRSDEEEEVEDEDRESDDGDEFFVEPCYLSDGEGDDESGEKDDAEVATKDADAERRARLAARADEWKQRVLQRKHKLLVPRCIGPSYLAAPAPLEAIQAVLFD